MSKIDWAEAEVKYVTKPEASYDWLVQLFGVAKSTIVRHAVKEDWPKKRKDYTRKRIRILEERTLQTRIQVEERQLRILRITQSAFHNEIINLALKEQRGEVITGKEWMAIASLTNAMTKAIMTERIILALPTKPVRITDAEAIENVRQMTGSAKPEPIYQKYRETKQILEGLDIDAIIKHKKILESYVKKVEDTGDYNVEHPLW